MQLRRFLSSSFSTISMCIESNKPQIGTIRSCLNNNYHYQLEITAWLCVTQHTHLVTPYANVVMWVKKASDILQLLTTSQLDSMMRFENDLTFWIRCRKDNNKRWKFQTDLAINRSLADLLAKGIHIQTVVCPQLQNGLMIMWISVCFAIVLCH